MEFVSSGVRGGGGWGCFLAVCLLAFCSCASWFLVEMQTKEGRYALLHGGGDKEEEKCQTRSWKEEETYRQNEEQSRKLCQKQEQE